MNCYNFHIPADVRSAGISQKILNELAKDIGEEKMVDLGFALGFPHSAITLYYATNRISGIVTSRGTLAMLVDWTESVPRRLQYELLYKALKEAGLGALAEKYLSKGNCIPTMPTILSQSCLN